MEQNGIVLETIGKRTFLNGVEVNTLKIKNSYWALTFGLCAISFFMGWIFT